ncbi:MAG TPA: hypothetical protein VEF71_19205 [Streptosporangiaceae bacterium]|nr:hypothetical protein [Streptosporangiaceae bacterium]
MPANSTPSPTARPVCSPIRRSSSAGTSRGRTGAGRGNTSSWPSPASTDPDTPPRPARTVTWTAPGRYRPHRSGRTTHRAPARPARRNVCVPGSPATSVTCGAACSWSVISSSSGGPGPAAGTARAVAVIVTSSPSKQRDPDNATCTASPAGRRRGISASAPSGGAASRTSAAWPVSTAAISASSAAVARLSDRGAGYQRTGPIPGRGTPAGSSAGPCGPAAEVCPAGGDGGRAGAPRPVRARKCLFMRCFSGRAPGPGSRRPRPGR